MGRWLEMALVGVDTETTGLSVTEDRVFEVALVTYEGGARTGTFCELIDPTRPLAEASLEKTGVRNEDLQGKPTFAHFAAEIVARMTDKVIVGYNLLGFDLPIIQSELRRVGLELPRCWPVDVLIFARGLVQGGRHNLSEMARKFDIAMETAHRADADADATVRLLLAMAPDLPPELDNLLHLQAQWREEQRARRAVWRGRRDEPQAPEVILGQESASQNRFVDAEGRVLLGPGYLYGGREVDPLRAFLMAYCNASVQSSRD
jgi:DNA polymerase III alpha subunit (gram-positive type)